MRSLRYDRAPYATDPTILVAMSRSSLSKLALNCGLSLFDTQLFCYIFERSCVFRKVANACAPHLGKQSRITGNLSEWYAHVKRDSPEGP